MSGGQQKEPKPIWLTDISVRLVWVFGTFGGIATLILASYGVFWGDPAGAEEAITTAEMANAKATRLEQTVMENARQIAELRMITHELAIKEEQELALIQQVGVVAQENRERLIRIETKLEP